jgi:hypothetical protein
VGAGNPPFLIKLAGVVNLVPNAMAGAGRTTATGYDGVLLHRQSSFLLHYAQWFLTIAGTPQTRSANQALGAAIGLSVGGYPHTRHSDDSPRHRRAKPGPMDGTGANSHYFFAGV